MSRKFTNNATSRLKQDYLRLRKDPVPYITAEPLPANILEWHYLVQGPENTPYDGGMYHGKLVFPAEFPFKPPSIYMITPNGRFKVNTRLCLSISDYHPDTWNPAWSVSTILTGLLSFMLERSPTLGSIESSDFEKRNLAMASLEFNLKDKLVHELFPEFSEKMASEVARRKAEAAIAAERGLTQITNSALAGTAQLIGGGDRIQGVFTNLGIVACVMIFAWTVQCVLNSVEAWE